jgi:hypothetical protein
MDRLVRALWILAILVIAAMAVLSTGILGLWLDPEPETDFGLRLWLSTATGGA